MPTAELAMQLQHSAKNKKKSFKRYSGFVQNLVTITQIYIMPIRLNSVVLLHLSVQYV